MTQEHAVFRKEAAPFARCGSQDVVVITTCVDPSVVADGDEVRCNTCGARGVFCGATSDGLGTIRK